MAGETYQSVKRLGVLKVGQIWSGEGCEIPLWQGEAELYDIRQWSDGLRSCEFRHETGFSYSVDIGRLIRRNPETQKPYFAKIVKEPAAD